MIARHLFPPNLTETLAGYLARVDRPEFEQSLLRVAIGGAVMLYLFWYTLQGGAIKPQEYAVLWVSVGFFVLALALTAVIVVVRGVSVTRRYLAMFADNAVTTFCLYQMGEGGAVVIGVYLFITFGNGLRYGRRYLYVCQGLGLLGFTSVLSFSTFWSQHLAIGIGFLIGLLVLPVYVDVLAQRIKDAKRRADEASSAKGRFVANVSHEMRTPLNGVIAMADILRETDLSESQREIVDTLSTSAELLLAQIEDVLDMAKIEAGRVRTEARPFDLGKLLSAAVKVIVPQARYKDIAVAIDIAPEASSWHIGDPHHLRQVVLNLLSNAVKFTERGEIRLHARVAQRLEGKSIVRIEVADTGIGIPIAKQVSIFEPFAQADDSITRLYGGTGLGTTIARHLTEVMGGRIGVISEEGVGSTFWIEVPLTPSQAEGLDLTAALSTLPKFGAATAGAKATVHSNVHKLRKARVLVAEDNTTNQRVAQLILESGGHAVTIVDNGEGALDALERGGFDIALFDLSMPVVSGLEALKLYRFTNRNPIPVLIVSANVTTEVIAETLEGGAAEFVPKPLRASHLLEVIDRHLAQQIESPTQPRRSEERSSLSLVEIPILDSSVLGDLSRLSRDSTFMGRLLRGFRCDTERLVKEITQHITRREYELVRDAAHALKGGAASVGASQLAQQATTLEKTPAESLRIRSAYFIGELNRISNRTLEALELALETFDQLAAKENKLGS